MGFFNQMRESFGASTNALAQEYVMAHEAGHHIQNLQGNLGVARQDLQGADSGAVRVELQADCYAGMWARHASQPGDIDQCDTFSARNLDRPAGLRG